MLVVVAIFWQPIAAIWSILPKPIKAAILFLGSIAVAVQYGRNRGQQSERARQDAANARTKQAKEEINVRVDNMPPSVVDDNLRRDKWLRD